MKTIRCVIALKQPLEFSDQFVPSYLEALRVSSIEDPQQTFRNPMKMSWSGNSGQFKDYQENPWVFAALDIQLNPDDDRELDDLTADVYFVFVAESGGLPIWDEQIALMRAVFSYNHKEEDSRMYLPLSMAFTDPDLELDMQGFSLTVAELQVDPEMTIIDWMVRNRERHQSGLVH